MNQIDPTQPPAPLPSPEELTPVVALTTRLLEQMDRTLLGRAELHRMVLVGILSRGHILLEGLPGLGKTAMIQALSTLMDLQFRRVQFTPDLMPGDVLGTHILQETEEGGRDMTFQPGPVFTNILLADEINRASPRTQSALLEAMQERRVTLMGTTRKLPEPFFVLASQNPIELEGTYPLPEAQLDRFLMKIPIDALDAGVLEEIIATRRRGEPPEATWRMTREQLDALLAMMDRLCMPRPVSRYIARLTSSTHPATPEATERVRQYVTYGASPRAAIAMSEAARAHALLSGRPTAGFEDVRAVAPYVLNHRLILSYKARFDGVSSLDVVEELLGGVDEVGAELPEDISVATGRQQEMTR
jgi:MoxR-like ATPase